MCNFERTKLSKGLTCFILVSIIMCVISGDDGIEVTLLPIPNRKVKVYNADGTAWATMWESRKLPGEL